MPQIDSAAQMDQQPEMPIEPALRPTPARRELATSHALFSAFIPGLGQLLQRRWGAAAAQFGTVAAYLAGAVAVGGQRALLFALFWNLWSVWDAYRHDRD